MKSSIKPVIKRLPPSIIEIMKRSKLDWRVRGSPAAKDGMRPSKIPASPIKSAEIAKVLCSLSERLSFLRKMRRRTNETMIKANVARVVGAVIALEASTRTCAQM